MSELVKGGQGRSQEDLEGDAWGIRFALMAFVAVLVACLIVGGL